MLDVGGEQLREMSWGSSLDRFGGVSHLDGAKSSTRALFSAIST